MTCRIEETGRLWCKFLDDYSRFEEWLSAAEVTAGNPESADVLYTSAKEELKKFEVGILFYSSSGWLFVWKSAVIRDKLHWQVAMYQWPSEGKAMEEMVILIVRVLLQKHFPRWTSGKMG